MFAMLCVPVIKRATDAIRAAPFDAAQGERMISGAGHVIRRTTIPDEHPAATKSAEQ